MVENSIIEHAARVLIAKEIEEAGRRVGKRLQDAIGQLAKHASNSAEIKYDVTSEGQCVTIKVSYCLGSLVDPYNNHPASGAPVPAAGDLTDDETEALSADLAADNPVDEDFAEIDEQMIYTGDEEAAVEELQLNPDDIEMIEVHDSEFGEEETGQEVDGGLAAEMLEMENPELNEKAI